MPNTISQIRDVSMTRVLYTLRKFESIAILSREQPSILPDHPYFHVNSRGTFINALRSVNADLIAIFLVKSMLSWVPVKAVRIRANTLQVPVLVICCEDGINWPDNVESRMIINKDGCIIESSPFSRLFNLSS